MGPKTRADSLINRVLIPVSFWSFVEDRLLTEVLVGLTIFFQSSNKNQGEYMTKLLIALFVVVGFMTVQVAKAQDAGAPPDQRHDDHKDHKDDHKDHKDDHKKDDHKKDDHKKDDHKDHKDDHKDHHDGE